MKRFELIGTEHEDTERCPAEMELADDGEYVLFADVVDMLAETAQLLAEKDAEIERLRAMTTKRLRLAHRPPQVPGVREAQPHHHGRLRPLRPGGQVTAPALMGWLQLVDEAAALRKRLEARRGRPKGAEIAAIEARLEAVGDELRKRMDASPPLAEVKL
jgi:hypothetical protein